MKLQKFSYLLSIFYFISSITFAGGNDFTTTNASKIFSLNGLYIAGLDGVSNIINNPASLASLSGVGFELSLKDQMGEQYFESDTEGYFQSFRNDEIILGGGFYYNFNDGLTVGIAYAPVLNYNVDWAYSIIRSKGDNSSIFSFDYSNRINVNSITPGISYKFGDFLIGVTGNIYTAKMETAFPIENPFWLADSGLASYQANYNLDGLGYGFGIGITYQASNELSIAASLRSSYEVTLEGNARSEYFSDIYFTPAEIDVETNFEMPWIISGGLRYELSSDLAVNIDGRINLWSNIENMFEFDFNDTTWQRVLNNVDSSTGITGNNFNTSFDNSIDFGLGLEYVTSNIAYRAGYRYSSSPFKDSMYGLLFNNVDQHWFSIGIGLRQNQWAVDVSLGYSIGSSKQISNTNLEIRNGNYDNQLFLPSINLRYLL